MYVKGVTRRTVLSSSFASSSSGSVVTEGVLGLYQEICSTRPLNFAPWLAAWQTETGKVQLSQQLLFLCAFWKITSGKESLNSGIIMSHATYVLCFTSRLKGHDDTVGVLVADFLNLAKFLRLKKDESEVEIRVSC